MGEECNLMQSGTKPSFIVAESSFLKKKKNQDSLSEGKKAHSLSSKATDAFSHTSVKNPAT